ncbi:hypothetical protein BV22DRAFT_1019043 [Leucogyrophana mollusca]|uniref:Uncharacterized protein n=1 Tax=Leucogyrophana mollusca TaxID=85980 RepID=A0ACB8B838_9AGAM|nr:hypothetical protein BV22DRAFT_1019043 [Leucogyrophana mollusca]
MLRQLVEDGKDSRIPVYVMEMPPGKRWAWFVALAVERYSSFTLDSTDIGWKCLPPLDVVMVWHAYLLNPSWYDEDTTRVSHLRDLTNLSNDFPAYLDNPGILTTTTPDLSRVEYWEARTSTAYYLLDSGIDKLAYKLINCPSCSGDVSAPFIGTGGSGYAQSQFSVVCTVCAYEITREKLGLHKLARNLAAPSPQTDSTDLESYLAGTVHTPFAAKDTKQASSTKENILAAIDAKGLTGRISSARDLVIQYKSMQSLRAAVSQKIGPKLLDRILSAYTDDRIFSLDLAGAVLRQGSFIQKMHDLGWAKPSCFDSPADAVVIGRCIARYHAFLDLMVRCPDAFLVPTLDIDLAWHTHQLMAIRYQKDCATLVGRYVDHSDKVDEGKQSAAFDNTYRLWEERYKAPYTHCGLSAPPPRNNISHKLLRVINRRRGDVTNTLLPPQFLEPTHPSDHDAIFTLYDKDPTISLNARKLRKEQRQRYVKNSKQGAANTVMDSSIHPHPFAPRLVAIDDPYGCVAESGAVMNETTNRGPNLVVRMPSFLVGRG